MIRFDRRQLISFIRAVDRNLAGRVKAVVIGGAAAAVGYHSPVATADIDILTLLAGTSRQLVRAAEGARAQTGLAVALGGAAVAEMPLDYERRLRSVRGLVLERLSILVPDKYDLALSKTVRGYPHDLAAIEGLHRFHRLAYKTLLRRFETELVNYAIADPQRIRLNVVMLVARLYGLAPARELAARYGVPVPKGAR